ncbi:N-acetylglucosaminyldiphosphodolichol N-acetylglucosaminyltransferase catalytic subunit alg13, partial [Elasticomyces elasticus]
MTPPSTPPPCLPSPPQKLCFVTIGATAAFDSLIASVLSRDFLAALRAHQYTDVLIQYGIDGEAAYEARLREVEEAAG